MPRYGHRSDPQMHVADSVMTASVGSRIFGSSRSTTRTSPAEYITTPRTSHVLSVQVVAYRSTCHLGSRLRNRLAVCLEGDTVWLRPAADPGVERVDRRDLVVGELKIKDGEVLGDPSRFGRLRDGRAAFLQ